MEQSLTVEKKSNSDVEKKQTCWSKRTKKEKTLILFTIGASLVLLVLVGVSIAYFASRSSTCLSSGCVKATHDFLKFVQTDLNPCDDFYQFACGKFAKDYRADDDVARSVEDLLTENIDNRIRGIVEEAVSEQDGRPLTLAKNLYRACLNQDAIDIRGVVAVQHALKQIGGWPVLEGSAWNEWNFEWKLATYKLRELGYNYQFFIGVDVVPDVRDPLKVMIKFSPPDTPLRGATDADEELFFEYMVNISVAFGANRDLARSDFRDVIDFQKSLFLNLPEDLRGEKYDPLTISELRHKFSDIPWMEYINRLVYPVQSVSYDQTVTVKGEAYFTRLQNALRRITKRVVANYIAWRTVRQQSVFLTSELSDLSWNYYSAMVNQTPPTPAKKCADLTDYVFSLPLQAEYVKRFLSKHTKPKVYHVLKNIKNAFTQAIGTLDWMDAETKALAIERIVVTQDKVAYPNALLESRQLDEYYQGVEVDPDNFFQSMLQANFFDTNRKFVRLHEPLSDKYELDEAYATFSQVRYRHSDNSISIPAGLLQGVMYDDYRLQCLNYGALGSTLGHQVFHVVFEGRRCRTEPYQYDWLTTRTLLNFDRKLSCLEAHYGDYFLPELGEHLNSSNTKHEDAADIAGIKLAYNAYKIWVDANGAEQKLPGFDYTPLQLFWVSSALRFCNNENAEDLARTVRHSYHSPKKYRVLGALSNLEEFSRDFGCSSGSYMNNKHKCIII